MSGLNSQQDSLSHTDNSVSLSKTVSRYYKILLPLELALIFFGSLIFSLIRLDRDLPVAITQYPGAPKVFLYPLLWYFCLYITHSWDRSIFYQSSEYYRRVIEASWKCLLIFAAFAFLLKYSIPRFWVIINAVGILIILLANRFIFRLLYLKPFKNQTDLTYIYIGTKNSQKEALKDFYSTYGFHPHIVVLEPPKTANVENWLEEYKNLSLKYCAYGTIIGVGQIQNAPLLRRLADFNREQIIDFLLSTRLSAITHRFEQLEAPNLVRLRESTLVSSGASVKRIFDVFFSLIALVLISPLMLIIALIVKATSKGPAIYAAQRIGKNGQLFMFPKFRSMYVGADQERDSVLGRPDKNMFDRYKKDPRITPFGRFLRRWSLDELPQFWCVLIGTMSVVGPRPILKDELSQIPDAFQIRFLAKPGLTGLWQVTGRKEVPWEERMLRDVIYIDNWNLSLDLVLIAKTVNAIVKGNGAI